MKEKKSKADNLLISFLCFGGRTTTAKNCRNSIGTLLMLSKRINACFEINYNRGYLKIKYDFASFQIRLGKHSTSVGMWFYLLTIIEYYLLLTKLDISELPSYKAFVIQNVSIWNMV